MSPHDIVWYSHIWDGFIPESYPVDRLRLVTTRMVTAGGTGTWTGYFASSWSGGSFIHQDCAAMMPMVDICDMFREMQPE